MVDVQDLLSRNALLSAPYKLYPGAASDMGDLTGADTITTEILDQIQLGMQFRDVPSNQYTDGHAGEVICLTSPGVIFDLVNQVDPAAWQWRVAYADPSRLLNMEVGSLRNVRFISTPKCCLFNAGDITIQADITVPINAGDGAPTSLVDGVWHVGQTGVRNYVQLSSSTDMSEFSINDIVTVHVGRTNANGTTNGLDYLDGKLENRRIIDKNDGSYRLMFEEPIMEDFTTDLGSGVYGYVTKGTHVHTSIFLGGSDGIINGVGQPPRMYTPPPIDDYESIYRFTWDSYQGYQVYNPKVMEVFASAGTFRNVGPIQLAG